MVSGPTRDGDSARHLCLSNAGDGGALAPSSRLTRVTSPIFAYRRVTPRRFWEMWRYVTAELQA